ncbi:hypothetical protein BGZ63DRAFT_439508 [Mariannaea sp. PMI_226]|nr:hypothetical protein BGZ63DRAFT_439508 [Mariannaea sp. PMI_226]
MADHRSRMGYPHHSYFEKNHQSREACERTSAPVTDFSSPPFIHDPFNYDAQLNAPGRHDQLNQCFPAFTTTNNFLPTCQQPPPQPSYFLPLQSNDCLWSQAELRIPQSSSCLGDYSSLGHVPEPCNVDSCSFDPSFAYQGPPINDRLMSNGFHDHLASEIFESPFGHDASLQTTQKTTRQRTQFACRHCRKRKTRCSGYQSAQGGKCQSCARMGVECSFQTVASSRPPAVAGGETLRRLQPASRT